MLASYQLLSRFVDLSGIAPEEIADKLTFAGLEVEAVKPLSGAKGLVIGKILKAEKHPDSDHLHVLQVDEGEKYGVCQIVCGAPNARENLKVIVARPGAVLSETVKIGKSKIRGVDSEGMCCSLSELGIDKLFLSEKQISGIEELDENAPVGEENVLDYLGLNDTVFDINVLANRSDVQAVYSLAKELSALFSRPLKIPQPLRYQEKKTAFTCSSATRACPQFSIKAVRNVKTKASPVWLKNALMAQGIRSINNIVDIGNYVMVLTGQPLHMYDSDKLRSTHFEVRDDLSEDVVCLDGKTYTLLPGDLVVTNGGEPVCIAGTMGLLSVAVDENTKNIAVESANFKGSSVRRTSTRIGLSSESSAHFVKGINPKQDEFVLNLTAQLLVELADAEIVEETSRYAAIEEKPVRISCSVTYINRRLGTDFDYAFIASILEKLQIRIEESDGDRFVAVPPDHRIDLLCDADLSEEVIRFAGFSRIPSRLPSMETTRGGYTPVQEKRLKVRSLLIDAGIDEALTYTLIAPKEDEFVLLNQDRPYVVFNPMSVDHSVVRRGLVSSLLNVIAYNLAHQQENLAFFEVSDIITTAQNYQELCVVLNGKKSVRGKWVEEPYDYFDARGILDAILSALGIEKNRYKEERLTDSPYFHPGRSTKCAFGKDVFAYVGQIHPSYSKEIGETYVLDVNLSALFDLKVGALKARPIGRFPSVRRDLALIVKKEVLSSQIVQAAKKAGKSRVKSVDIFDVYEGEHLQKGTKSIAVSITFEDENKTLTEPEIAAAMQGITEELSRSVGAELRK